jgi:hypothetical protein
MRPATSYELATPRIAHLRGQAQRDALTRAATRVPSSTPQPGSNRIPISLRRIGRPRFGTRLWTLLHAQALLDGCSDGRRRVAR